MTLTFDLLTSSCIASVTFATKEHFDQLNFRQQLSLLAIQTCGEQRDGGQEAVRNKAHTILDGTRRLFLRLMSP